MPKDTRKIEDQQDIGRKDPQQFGTGVPLPDLNPSAPTRRRKRRIGNPDLRVARASRRAASTIVSTSMP
jgi:hypothetical protein